MKLKHALSTTIATAILALGAPALHAQTSAPQPQPTHGKTPAYYIAEFELTDPEEIRQDPAVPPAFRPYQCLHR